MIVEYDVFCFDRTLTLVFSDKVKYTPEIIVGYLDVLYDKWQNAATPDIECMPLEEFLVLGVAIFCEEFPTWTSTDNEEV